jgi:hypothetical protein
MKINDLPIGTKLMWDAPLPFEGYVSSFSRDKSKILLTAIVSERDTKHPKGTRINTGQSNNWIGSENEYLRLPTEEELEKYEWPILK